jgi:hypothetical protein
MSVHSFGTFVESGVIRQMGRYPTEVGCYWIFRVSASLQLTYISTRINVPYKLKKRISLNQPSLPLPACMYLPIARTRDNTRLSE